MNAGLEIGTPLASAMALGVLWTLEGAIPMFAPTRGRWRDRMHNMAMAAINSAATSTVFAALTYVCVEGARGAGLGVLRWIDAPAWVVWVAGLLAIDLAYYAFHVLAHHWGWLWRFHVVHHHDTAVDVTSAVRFHVGEIAVQSVAMVGVYVVLGVGMAQVLAYQIILIPVAMFHHANIVMPERVDRALRLVIVTPRMHWVHHSRWQPETDSNYSGVLSWWDRLFGTFRLRRDPRTIDFGLDGYDEGYSGTLVGMMATPFGEAHAGPGAPPRVGVIGGEMAKEQRAKWQSGAERGAPCAGGGGAPKGIRASAGPPAPSRGIHAARRTGVERTPARRDASGSGRAGRD